MKALPALLVLTACFSRSPRYHKPAYVVDAVLAGTGALLTTAGAIMIPDCTRDCQRDHRMVTGGIVLMLLGAAGAWLNSGTAPGGDPYPPPPPWWPPHYGRAPLPQGR